MGQDEEKLPPSEDEMGNWQYKPSGSAAPQEPSFAEGHVPPASSTGPASSAEGDVEWTASEFVSHEKNVVWYLLLAGITILISAAVYWLTNDIFSTGVVAVVGAIFAIAGSRKPRVLTYRLDRNGLTIGAKLYPYGNYKSFAYLDEKPFASIVFIPMKRFGVPISVYLAPEDERRVVEALSKHLPLERGRIDAIDRLMRSVRF